MPELDQHSTQRRDAIGGFSRSRVRAQLGGDHQDFHRRGVSTPGSGCRATLERDNRPSLEIAMRIRRKAL
jgi:hypothetical protein